ncbi:MAG: cobalt-precorrin-5B (C(1))-methyltransferase [Methanospirillaceae archaeon]|nr:cobalt-precorrin-5B (C(1))-methyltransferase [Methanospirillaceae archaeon]
MSDPVSGFVYPPSWIAACTDASSLERVRQGLAILTASGKVLLRGYTTGTTAAAACKAAILSLQRPVHTVEITVPAGLTLSIGVTGLDGTGQCRKYSGDYPSDATSGLLVIASATPCRETELFAGEGIGRWERDTPRFLKGDPAISPTAREEIENAIAEALREIGLFGVAVSVCVPKGSEVALQTLNERVGVLGGISILGTTGLVEPWDDHLEESIYSQLATATMPVLTTGRIGMKYARMYFPENEVILVGSRIDAALSRVSGKAILCGLPGLILRYINPDILKDTSCKTVEEMVPDPGFPDLLLYELSQYKQKRPDVRVVITGRDGRILGESP